MLKRPHAHRVRDIASLSVEMVFAGHGWATEPVLKDYGLDLLVQPCHGDDVEEFKLWVQVKGVQRMDEANAWIVSVEHARLWARSKEYVVFVVWDLNTETGSFCLPRHQISDWELFEGDAKSVTLKPDGSFDSEALKKLHVIAMLDHYQHRIVARKLDWEWRPLQAPEANGRTTFVATGKGLIVAASDLMVRLAILAEKDGRLQLDRELVSLWHDTERHLPAVGAATSPTLTRDAARLLLAISVWVHSKTGVAPPLQLSHTLAQTVMMMIENGFVDPLRPMSAS